MELFRKKSSKPLRYPRAPRAPRLSRSQRRNFRPTVLEVLMMVAIVIGVLQLANVWSGGAAAEGDGQEQGAAPPRRQITRALAASQKAQAMVASTRKEFEELRKDISGLKRQLRTGPSSKTVPALAARVRELEKDLARSRRDQQKPQAPARADQKTLKDIEKRLAALEKPAEAKSAVDLGPLDKRLKTLEKAVADRPAVGPGPLEKRLAALEKNQAQLLAGRSDLTPLGKRLDRLEREQANQQAALQAGNKALPAMEARLQRLEQGLAQAQAQARQAKPQVRAPMPADWNAILAMLRQGSSRAGDSALRQEQVALAKRLDQVGRQQDRLEKRLAALSKDRPEPAGDKELARRVAALEKRLGEVSRRAAAPPPARAATPTRTFTYTVQRGDTLYSLVRRFKVSLDELRRYNPKLQRRNMLYTDERLTIPKGPGG